MYGILHQTFGNEVNEFFVKSVRPLSMPVASLDDIQVTEDRLRAGDLLRVFNSIISGEELVTLNIDLSYNPQTRQDEQKDFDRELWENLFYAHLPARLLKADGAVIDGNLTPFTEQGMEGFVAWSLTDFERKGYESLHSLEKGDKLTIYSSIIDGKIVWEGSVDLEEQPYKTGNKVPLLEFETVEGQRIVKSVSSIDETFAQTHIFPTHGKLDQLSIMNCPLQLVR